MIFYNQTQMANAYRGNGMLFLSAFIKRELEIKNLGETAAVGFNQIRGNVPKSNLPYLFTQEAKENTTGKTLVLTDMYGVKDREQDFRQLHSYLIALWEDPSIGERFTSVRKFATKAYINWFGRTLANRYNIEFDDKQEMDIILAIYFYTIGGDLTEALDKRNYKLYSDIAEITNAGAVKVSAVIAKHDLDTFESFGFETMVHRIQNISKDLATKLGQNSIMAALSRSWHDEGGVFYCNLAIEYPPTFLALLYAAITDRGYSKTPFGRMVKEFAIGRNVNLGDTYVRQIGAIVKGINPTSD